MKPKTIHVRDLLIWKKTECNRCTFTTECPKDAGNIRKCALEEESCVDAMFTLSRRIHRYYHAAKRGTRTAIRLLSGKVLATKPEGPPKDYKAVLLCSDMDEYEACFSKSK